MTARALHRIALIVVITLSLIALFAVLSGFLQPPQPDEGTAAHIFQLSIAALVPALVVFFATTDWKTPWQTARALAFSASTVLLALGALYCLEHLR